MNSNFMALCSEKVEKALNQVSGGLCYFTAEAKHAQLLDVQKTLSEVVDALASLDAATQSEAGVLNNETSDYRRGREDGLAEGYLRGEADAAARADSKISPEGPELPARILTMCKKRGWSLHWTSRGAYLHLEASELIEALRGKRSDPLSEAADVLLVLMSITENAGIPWAEVLNQTAMTCSRLEVCDPYPGEERGPLAQPESEQIPPGPYSEHDLRTQWNAQADECNQWESLDLSEQLAWAQACAVDMSEYTDSEWAEIKRWEQEPSATQPAPPAAPVGGLVETLTRIIASGSCDDMKSFEDIAKDVIREVAALWLDLEGYNRTANDLRQETGK
jgi:hypothetical protein